MAITNRRTAYTIQRMKITAGPRVKQKMKIKKKIATIQNQRKRRQRRVQIDKQGT